MSRVGAALRPVAEARAGRWRVLVSAHASLEELFLVREITRALQGPGLESGVTITWRYRKKIQPAATKFRVPPVDAPNVNGARDLGFMVPPGQHPEPDTTGLRAAIEAGEVEALRGFVDVPAGVGEREVEPVVLHVLPEPGREDVP
jgi:hypothetical protein